MTVNIAGHDFTILWDGVYCFALSDYPHISPWELKKLLAFMAYEKLHGRQTEITCENTEIMGAVHHAIAHPETVAHATMPEKITECTACKQKGCLTKFVCHTASVENAAKIFSCGKLLSALKASGKPASELVSCPRNAAGDPADFFDYIMFSWGNCQAGDRLVMERKLGRSPNEHELQERFTPGVRFFFRYDDIAACPGYVFDGYHPAKIKDELRLSDCLYACVIPEQYRLALAHLVPEALAARVHFVAQDGLGIWDWSEKVYAFVEGC